MTAKQLIGMALQYKGMTFADLARKLETTPQQLHGKIERGKLTLDEWNRIALAIGATKAEMHFYFPEITI